MRPAEIALSESPPIFSYSGGRRYGKTVIGSTSLKDKLLIPVRQSIAFGRAVATAKKPSPRQKRMGDFKSIPELE
jgi:hypothetical protein